MIQKIADRLGKIQKINDQLRKTQHMLDLCVELAGHECFNALMLEAEIALTKAYKIMKEEKNV